MKIGIVTSSYLGQAAVVKDSIESFFRYGAFRYSLIQLKRGEIRVDINEFDALIIHYSCIAFPYRYELPISALSALKISQFPGLKLALVQDEQRACYERLYFLNNLGVNHVFSVAPKNLHETLYPSGYRNFTVSTILTGYVSDDHLKIGSRKLLLKDRPIDVAYRGRCLPEWMGEAGTLKGQIPSLVHLVIGQKKQFDIDVSNLEEDRLYGSDWYRFLLKSKVSIGTPSGSNYLDLSGSMLEEWVKNKSKVVSKKENCIRADYTVISPRYFDYVASGNLVALTPGNYSGIPNTKDFITVEPDMSNLEDILKFSITLGAQKMVESSKERILNRLDLRYSGYVSEIEKQIQIRSPKGTSYIVDHKRLQKSEFPRSSQKAIFEVRIRNIVNKMKMVKKILLFIRDSYTDNKKMLNFEQILLVKQIPQYKTIHFFNFKLVKELSRLNELLLSIKVEPEIIQERKGVKILLGKEVKKKLFDFEITTNKNPKHWIIDLSLYGVGSGSDVLVSLPKVLRFKVERLANLIENILKTSQKTYYS